MIYLNLPEFTWNTHNERGLGGSESGFVKTVEYLRKLGHEVHAFTQAKISNQIAPDGSIWNNVGAFDKKEPYDVVYSLRHREIFEERPNAKLTVLFLADTESIGLGQFVYDGRIDLVTSVSCWQGKKIADEETIHGDNMLYSSNGVEGEGRIGFDLSVKEPGRCMFTATPERGLENLLNVWPEIKRRVSYASLHLFSSFKGWGVSDEENTTMAGALYAKASVLEGITNHVHTAPWAIVEELKRADAYIYPSDFRETCCMSVLEGMFYGVIPVTTSLAALQEKVINGVTGFAIPPYGASTAKYLNMFTDRVVEVLTAHESRKKVMRENCMKYAEQFTYEKLVRQWADEWERRLGSRQ